MYLCPWCPRLQGPVSDLGGTCWPEQQVGHCEKQTFPGFFIRINRTEEVTCLYSLSFCSYLGFQEVITAQGHELCHFDSEVWTTA